MYAAGFYSDWQSISALFQAVPVLRGVAGAVRRLGSGRAAGADGMAAELLGGAEGPVGGALRGVIAGVWSAGEFRLGGGRALSSHSAGAGGRGLGAVAAGRFLFCLCREKCLHMSFWRAFGLCLAGAADLDRLVLLPGGLLWMPY